MKRSFASFALALLAGALCTSMAFAGDTNVRQPGGDRSFALPAHPIVSAPAPQPFVVTPPAAPAAHTAAATVTDNSRKRPCKNPAALQNWQLNWLAQCQRWIMGPQGQWLNPECYVPLFGLLGDFGLQSPFAGSPVFAPNSPF